MRARRACVPAQRAVIFFNDTATTEIYTLSLHDALPIFRFRAAGLTSSRTAPRQRGHRRSRKNSVRSAPHSSARTPDRKSTRLNSSHANISYAVFCLKKKNVTVWVGGTRLTRVIFAGTHD